MPGPIHRIEHAASLGEWTLTTAPPDARLTRYVKEFWEVEGAVVHFREALLPTDKWK